MEESTNQKSLRLRVFAGPNGSGKSTIINAVRDTTVNGFPIDVGYYINADDIASNLRSGSCNLSSFDINLKNDSFCEFAHSSGLLNEDFGIDELKRTYEISGNEFLIKDTSKVEQLAQLIARYLREVMLEKRKRFSFETVFSHPSNLDIMKRAAELGYKVYLYFVSTESPEINKYRVEFRVAKGGHDVPAEKIESRYYRSLSLLYEAAEIAYQAYFFDNSMDESPFRLVGHFKVIDGQKHWEEKEVDEPHWFLNYYKKQIK